MKSIGHLKLRDRVFAVRLAEVKRLGESWGIEIETLKEEFDGEAWAPYLYHQGLRLAAKNVGELQGQHTSWQNAVDDPHPEKGAMYVFGHEDVRNCQISFGELRDGLIQISWEGLCDVFWDKEFKDNVPFSCVCFGNATDAQPFNTADA
jgi:hypothetical protein